MPTEKQLTEVVAPLARIKGTPTAWDAGARCTCTRCGRFAVNPDVYNRDPAAVGYVCSCCVGKLAQIA